MQLMIVPPGSTYPFADRDADRKPDLTLAKWSSWMSRHGFTQITYDVRNKLFGEGAATIDDRHNNVRSVVFAYRPLPLASAPRHVLADYAQEAAVPVKGVSTIVEVTGDKLEEEVRRADEQWKPHRKQARGRIADFIQTRAFRAWPGPHRLYAVARVNDWFSLYDFDLLTRLEKTMRESGTRTQEMPAYEDVFYFCVWPEPRPGWTPSQDMRLPDRTVFGGPLRTARDQKARSIVYPIHEMIHDLYRTEKGEPCIEAYWKKGYHPQNLRITAVSDFEFIARGEELPFLPADSDSLYAALSQKASPV